MPAVVRKGDACTGHACFPPRANDGGSSDVFINGTGAHRQGDHWLTHKCGKNVHDGSMSGGSGTVFVNGRPLARVGDMVSCGSAAAVGSRNVFAGG
jgi:uncharacterized Zn-binding protein involved in type VI secretion